MASAGGTGAGCRDALLLGKQGGDAGRRVSAVPVHARVGS